MTTPASPARPWWRLLLIGTASATCALSASAASAAPTQVTLVSNYQAGNVYLLDQSYAWARTYATVTFPQKLSISPDSNFAAVSGANGTSGGKASIINLGTHAVTDFDYTSTGASGTLLSNPVFSSNSRYAFFAQRNVTAPSRLVIHRVDLTTGTPTSQTAQVAAITSCGEPALAMQVVGGVDRLWVGCYTSGQLTGLDTLYAGTFAPTSGVQWTMPFSNTNAIAISTDQTTAYLATLSNGVVKVTLASGSQTQINATPNCYGLIVNAPDTYAYAACGSINSATALVRVPTTGGAGASNSGNLNNGLRLAFNLDQTEILQPGPGLGFTGGLQVQRWTVSGLNGTAIPTTFASTPAFDAPYGVAVGLRPAAPDAPTGASASAGNAQATVSWTAPVSDGGSALTGYTVTAAPGGATCTATPPQTTCTVTGLTNGTAYTFSIVASNAIGTSAASSSSAPVTPAAPTPTPAPQPGQQGSNSNPGTGSGSSASPSGGITPATPTLAVRDVAASNQAKSATIASRVVVSGAGSVRQVGTRARGQSARTIWGATARANDAVLCTASRRTPRAGTYRMTCTLGAGARAELERRSIRVRLATTFTPTGGTPITRTETVVLTRITAAVPAVTG